MLRYNLLVEYRWLCHFYESVILLMLFSSCQQSIHVCVIFFISLFLGLTVCNMIDRLCDLNVLFKHFTLFFLNVLISSP